MSTGTRRGDSGDGGRHSFVAASWLFLRLLAVINAIAFVSFWLQLDGLIGSTGITPAAELLERAAEAYGSARFFRMPTLFWLDVGDAALHAACAVGVACAALLGAGLAPRACLALVWLMYLSLASVSDVFLGYQWDILLLEMNLLAILLAPPGLLPRRATTPPPHAAALWLLRALLAKLVFLSGYVKLASGDAAWRDLTALEYHYWTQPLPTWTSVYASELPAFVHELSTLLTLALELGLPLLVLLPRRLRLAGAAGNALLQLLILTTGNYGFFNLLTLALCVLLIDDAALQRLTPARLRARLRDLGGAARRPSRLRRAGFAAVVSALALLNALVLTRALLPPGALPGSLFEVSRAIAPLRSINSYGLFAVMTKRRPEIVVEGSDDGASWRAYEFKWKPGRLDRRPAFVAPHQPRLDWQMWFAALRGCRGAPWFVRFSRRLLEGSEPVLALLEENPFPDAPPRYLRSTLYLYRFAPAAERAAHGRIWRRREPGSAYCPVFTLRDGELSVEVPLRPR